ncbi:ARL14 effector protein [Frankliniella fusca]|uniref:ARL14 effector protein n=1 Tax=Frankliniella fusca TaxID=407009 RepID=A0AAE1LE77_9NEOP|nr:ARL14 effector protein [Frankliniella fusca]
MDREFYGGLCSVGLDGSCRGEVKPCTSLSAEDYRIITIRSGIKAKYLCKRHHDVYLTLFELHQKYCCDPYGIHKQKNVAPVKSNVVSMLMYQQSKQVSNMKNLLPGQKLCKRCGEREAGGITNVICGIDSEGLQSSSSTSLNLEAGGVSNVNVGLDGGQAQSLSSTSLNLEASGIPNVIGGFDGEEPLSSSRPSISVNFPKDFEDHSVQEMLHKNENPGPNETSLGALEKSVEDLFADDEANNQNDGDTLQDRTLSTDNIKDRTLSSEAAASSSSEDPTYIPDEEKEKAAVTTLNAALEILKVPLVDKRKLSNEVLYGAMKIRKVTERFENLITEAGGQVQPSFQEEFLSKSLEALKSKYKNSKNNTERIGVLSIALVSMNQLKVLEEFSPVGATYHTIKKAAQLMREQGGILPTPTPKRGHPLAGDVVELIVNFYELDDVSSRLMPGMRDVVSVKVGTERVKKQKRLVLSTLRELFKHFKEQNPGVKVSFSKFASLRPKHCVLAGASGTHSVCVCKYHQNFKLLLEGANFKKYDPELKTYHDILRECVCESPTANCYLESCCSACPGTEILEAKLRNFFDDNLIDKVEYQQWASTDRCHLETYSKDAHEFLVILLEQLKTLLPHHFIAKSQSKFYRELKGNLKEGEILTVCDFAENYTCVQQDEIQEYYWRKEQVTLHPFSSYYKNSNGELKVISFAVVSDYMKHHKNSVYAFQKEFINFIKSKIPNVKKIFYFSDGAAHQYKNKYNALTLSYHYEDFGIEAEWHYFGTSHGKGPCDGMAGTLKRRAYLDSLRKKEEERQTISNPLEFFVWTQKRIREAEEDPESEWKISTGYVTKEQVEGLSVFLKKRFSKVLQVPKIRDQHSLNPDSQCEIKTKRYSYSIDYSLVPVESVRLLTHTEHLAEAQYVAVHNENQNWILGEVQLFNETTEEVLLKLMTMERSPSMWRMNKDEEENPYDKEAILAIASPTLSNGIYHLSEDDVIKIVWQSNIVKEME